MGCVALGFMLNNSSYFGDILRAGLESVPRGQREAARSTGMGRLGRLLYVEIPQAVRNVFPDLVSNMIEVVKLTSIASVVSVPEMLTLHAPRNRCSTTPRPSCCRTDLYRVAVATGRVAGPH